MTFKNKAERLAYRQSLIDSYEAEDARKKALQKTWREDNKDLKVSLGKKKTKSTGQTIKSLIIETTRLLWTLLEQNEEP